MRLRGEYARSHTDFDGAATALDTISDDAWGLLAVYQHPQSEVRGSAFSWNVGAEHKRIGPWFFSLANSLVATDKMLVGQHPDRERNRQRRRQPDDTDAAL